jgi:putative ABC transport system permease protein
MWIHYLLTFYRSLTRHRLYAALNILGLAIGIAVFLVLWLDVRFETGFERWIPNARSIYQLQTAYIGEGRFDQSSMGGALDELRGDYPGMIGARGWRQNATIRQGAQVTSGQVELVDPTFFDVFDLPLIQGDKAALLRTPGEVVLTQARARQYFGAADPIGRSLTVSFLGAAHTYRVSGVMKDFPRDTDLTFDFLVPLTPQMSVGNEHWRNWRDLTLTTYLRFDRPEAARALAADLDNFLDRHAGQDLTPPPAHKLQPLRIEPLVSLHLSQPKDAWAVAAVGMVGLMTLLLAGVNYVNLAAARAGLRAREVALRKVMGATGPVLIGQFMGEALATALLAALAGVALCELALPMINAAGGLDLKIGYSNANSVLVPMALVVLAVGLGAGFYPALVLARFQPAGVLASARTPGGGRSGARVREALVLGQFSIAIAVTIATGVIVAQTHYLRRADLGFRRDGLIVVTNFDNTEITGAQRSALLENWRGLPNIVSTTSADVAAGVHHRENDFGVWRAGAAGQHHSMAYASTKEDFFRTYGARLVAGRYLDRHHGSDASPPPTEIANGAAPAAGPPANIVMNATAIRMLGFRDASDAIGKTVLTDGNPSTLNIVGVVDDLHLFSPHQPVKPTIYSLSVGDDFLGAIAGVRYAGADPRVVTGRMEQSWRRIVPTIPFRAITAEDNLQSLYQADDQHGRLFTIGAVLAVAIGCVGLYGLASFTTGRRVKEIGIRKTLGASTTDILRLLVGQFLRPVLLANLVAWPLAWFAMRGWLATFDQRVGLSPLYFLAATALTLVIAVGTVAGQAFAVARAEPAKALRHE